MTDQHDQDEQITEETPESSQEEGETPEQPTEQGKELELDDDSQESTPSDPLDGIDDIEELRKRAKGYRAASRRKPKEEPEEVEEAEETQSDFLTRKDFYKSNERKAIHSLTRVESTDSDEVKAQKQFISDNWDHIKTLYTPRSGKDTPEDILDDLKDAVTLYAAKNPPQQESNAEVLSTTVATGAPSRPQRAETKAEPPRFKMPVQPDEWYPKKEESK